MRRVSQISASEQAHGRADDFVRRRVVEQHHHRDARARHEGLGRPRSVLNLGDQLGQYVGEDLTVARGLLNLAHRSVG